MSADAPRVVADGTLDASQWIIAAAGPGRAVRFGGPVGEGAPEGVWVEVRPLTHREALEREALGTYEECSLSPDGGLVAVTRRYDLWAMAEYDYTCALTDFCLPVREADGSVSLRRMQDAGHEGTVALLAAMPPALACWVQECVDRVNLRDVEGLRAMGEAQKKSAN
jgi:hypothetical protein